MTLGGFTETFAFSGVQTSVLSGATGSVAVDSGSTLFRLSEAMATSGADMLWSVVTWPTASEASGMSCTEFDSYSDYPEVGDRKA